MLKTMQLKTNQEYLPIFVKIKKTFVYNGHLFAIHRPYYSWNKNGLFDYIGHISNKGWGVSHYHTGSSIPIRGKRGESPTTRKEAEEMAKQILSKYSKQELCESIKRFYFEHGFINK